jgi:hypothetical protein
MRWVIDGTVFMMLLVGCGMPSPSPSAMSAFGSASPSAVLPVSPSPIAGSPVSSATHEASVPQFTVVAADDSGGRPMSLTIIDQEGFIATARAATPEEITPLADRSGMPSMRIAAAVARRDPPGILVVWVGSGCDRSGTVTLSAGSGQIVVAPDPRGGCDTIPIYRGLVLTFTIPVDPAAVRPVLIPTEILGA